MTNFDTVREALAAIADTHVHTYKQALAALAEIERQHFTPEDMADAQAKAFRAGVESVTAGQEPVAWQSRMRPTWGSDTAYPWSPWEQCTKGQADDHWKTPLLHEWAYEARALYTAAPVAQQPRQCGLCGSDEAFTGTCGGGRRDPRALCYEPVAQQPQAKRTWLTDPRQTKERQFAEFLNDRRNMNVSAVFHDLMGKFAALTAPQQAEAVPPGYVLVPIEPTKKMVDAGGFVKIEVTYTYAGYVDVHIGDDAARNAYRAMIAAAQGEKP